MFGRKRIPRDGRATASQPAGVGRLSISRRKRFRPCGPQRNRRAASQRSAPPPHKKKAALPAESENGGLILRTVFSTTTNSRLQSRSKPSLRRRLPKNNMSCELVSTTADRFLTGARTGVMQPPTFAVFRSGAQDWPFGSLGGTLRKSRAGRFLAPPLANIFASDSFTRRRHIIQEVAPHLPIGDRVWIAAEVF